MVASLAESCPGRRTCRYCDCVNALPDRSNVCPHEEDECECWITCNKCREWCGLETI
jgi:hypothetical protein